MFYTVFREVLPGGHCSVLSKRVPQRLISGILGVCFPVGSLSLWLLPLLPDPFISVAFWPLISPASWPLHLSLFLTPALLPAAHECCLVLLCSLLYFTHTHWDMGGRHHWSKESDFPTLVDRTMQLREKQQPMKPRAQERRGECGESIFYCNPGAKSWLVVIPWLSYVWVVLVCLSWERSKPEGEGCFCIMWCMRAEATQFGLC